MNKKTLIIFGLLVIILVIAIKGYDLIIKKGEDNSELTETVNNIEEIKGFTDIPQNFEIEDAIASGYFVIDGREDSDKIYNKNTLDRFIENTNINSKNRKPDKIRIANYNYDGYPTIYEIEYNEFGYILTIDASRNNIIPKSIITNDNIPGNIYNLIIDEDPGINAAIIKLLPNNNTENIEQYEEIEITRYLLSDEIVN